MYRRTGGVCIWSGLVWYNPLRTGTLCTVLYVLYVLFCTCPGKPNNVFFLSRARPPGQNRGRGSAGGILADSHLGSNDQLGYLEERELGGRMGGRIPGVQARKWKY
jgi:hypothetical protein